MTGGSVRQPPVRGIVEVTDHRSFIVKTDDLQQGIACVPRRAARGGALDAEVSDEGADAVQPPRASGGAHVLRYRPRVQEIQENGLRVEGAHHCPASEFAAVAAAYPGLARCGLDPGDVRGVAELDTGCRPGPEHPPGQSRRHAIDQGRPQGAGQAERADQAQRLLPIDEPERPAQVTDQGPGAGIALPCRHLGDG